MLFVRNLKLLNPSLLNSLEFKFSSTPCIFKTFKSLLQNQFPVSTHYLRQYSKGDKGGKGDKQNEDTSCCYVPVPEDHCNPPRKSIAKYCDVADFSMSKKKVVVDVRECDEVANGKIPKSTHIPLCHVKKALQASTEEFQKNYGCQKPLKSTDLIFYSNNGCRSSHAMEEAVNLGYCKSRNYKGGYKDFLEQSKKPLKDVCGEGCNKKK